MGAPYILRMKLLVIVLFVTGILMVMHGYFKQNLTCPPTRVVYKYIPRTLSEEESNPIRVSDIFSTMFNQSSPLDAGSGI